MVNKTLTKLAERHNEWVRMARSLPGKGRRTLSNEDANELVQSMYVKIHNVELNRIMFNEEEVNSMFVYVTLRNLYYSSFKVSNKTTLVESPEHSAIFSTTTTNEINDSLEHLKMDLEDSIKEEMDTWHFYDQRLFKIIFEGNISMRQLSRETNIGLSSIFNSIKSGKLKLKNKFKEDYNKLKKEENK